MTFAQRLEQWNLWYDGVPEEWRFQMLVWPLIVVGAINMILTIAMGFPFGFLVLLAILAAAVVRVPYLVGWVKPAAAGGAGPAMEPKISIAAVPWVWDANVWYDGLPETRRPWVILAVLAVAGAINMVLTIHTGFSFGILFLLALLGLILIRAPYTAGWLIPPPAPQERLPAAPAPGQIAQDNTLRAAPLHIAPAEPVPSPINPAPPAVANDLPPPDKPA
jgi:hypothetical protein